MERIKKFSFFLFLFVIRLFFGGTIDEMKEKGLTSHVLWLGEADFGKRNEKTRYRFRFFWLQYYLDNFATVTEASESEY